MRPPWRGGASEAALHRPGDPSWAQTTAQESSTVTFYQLTAHPDQDQWAGLPSPELHSSGPYADLTPLSLFKRIGPPLFYLGAPCSGRRSERQFSKA